VKTLSDLALARRIERAEGSANAGFVEARERLNPSNGAAWIEVAGTYAMFDGAESPVTQTFGLGMFAPVTGQDLDRIETFFRERGAPIHHEVSPLADPSVWPLLSERRYVPFEFTNVMFQDLPVSLPESCSDIRVRIATAGDADRWIAAATEGWSETEGLADYISEMMRVVSMSSGVSLFLAELDSRIVATGALNIQGDVALLAGASTIPRARRLGAQRALLYARLLYAAQEGCDIAVMGALPGSSSQRNAERQGFRIAYTRTKWRV
jgi:hypothetical protein